MLTQGAVYRGVQIEDDRAVNRQWAQRYVQLGFVVLPLWPGRKRPHASRRYPSLLGQSFSLKEAGADNPELVDRWWSAWPEAGIGIVCGVRSGLLVLDVDVKDAQVDGEQSFVDWEQERRDQGLWLPEAPIVRTPSGGVHLWYRLPPGVDVKGRDSFLPGVDACGSIHWVAAPPTLIADSGERYAIDRWPDAGVPAAPPWMITEIRSGRPVAGDRRTAVAGVPYDGSSRSYASGNADDLPPIEWFWENGLRRGSRDRDCYRLACRLWTRPGASALDVEEQIRPAWVNRASGEPDFSWEDAVGKIYYAREFVRRREQEMTRYRVTPGSTVGQRTVLLLNDREVTAWS